jgi:hypothetical protein
MLIEKVWEKLEHSILQTQFLSDNTKNIYLETKNIHSEEKLEEYIRQHPEKLSDEQRKILLDRCYEYSRMMLTFDVKVKSLPAGFFLDLCLPPDRAEETRVGLQEVYERRWLKRYSGPVARALCRVHGISTILAHHGSKISKFIAVVFGFLGIKKFTGWFSGS